MKANISIGLVMVVLSGTACWSARSGQEQPGAETEQNLFLELETKLQPLARKLGKPQPGEWLHEHKESGQSFDEYRTANPVLRSERRNRIYLCLVGDFTAEQQSVMDVTREYMEIFFDTPVVIRKRLPLKDIPGSAQRTHPKWGDKQVLTSYLRDEVLKPDRPDDALAYLAFTSCDLWPGQGWNFVYGEASLQERVGVWSMYRNGDPARGKDEFQLCLRRTLGTATHETGHILTMQHCTVNVCSMNGCNNQKEADGKPLHLCPICLRKLCWNLQVEPVKYLGRLEEFCRKHGLEDEAEWYRQARAALK
jgi:archaemetzincin